MSSESTKIPVATHHFLQRYLLAFATQAEVQHHLRTQAVEEESQRLPDILLAWNELQPKVANLLQNETGLADSMQVNEIPEEYRKELEAIAAEPLFQKTFSNLPTGFALVEIDKLVAPQRTVNLDYVDRLTTKLPKTPTLRQLLDFCVSHKRQMDAIQHLEIAPNTHAFSSPNSDMRFLGAFVKTLTDEDLKYAMSGGLRHRSLGGNENRV